MNHIKKLWLPVLIGAMAGVAANLLAMLFLRSLGGIMAALGGALDLGEELSVQLGDIFGQLKDQPMVLPWFRVVVAGCVSALLCNMILTKKTAWRITACAVAAFFLFVLLFLLALYYTEINSILFGDAIAIVIRILGSGVL